MSLDFSKVIERWVCLQHGVESVTGWGRNQSVAQAFIEPIIVHLVLWL